MGFREVHAYWRVAAVDFNEIDHKNLMDLHHHGGFSRNPLTGESPTEGYMVGIHSRNGGVAHSVSLGEFSPQYLATHRAAARHLLTQPGYYQGGWSDHNHVHLDVSKNVLDHDEAIREGHNNDQIAIWDVKNNREIMTHGKGEIA